MLKLSASPAVLIVYAALAVGALTASGCDEPEAEDPVEPEAPALGAVTIATLVEGVADGELSDLFYDAISVSFGNLGACDNREVELRAVSLDDEGVAQGGALPSRVPATGATPVVTFTSSEVIAARGALRPSDIEVILRCGDDEIERAFVHLRDLPAIAGLSGTMTTTGKRLDDVLVVDDGGVLTISSTVDSVNDDLIHVFLDAFDKDGVRRGTASDDLGPFDTFYYTLSQDEAVTSRGPGFDRLENGAYFVRLFDDQLAPFAGWAAIVDKTGAVVHEFADKAVVQAAVVDDRLVLVHVPFVTGRETIGDTVIDIVNASTGQLVVGDIATGLDIVEITALRSPGAGIVGVSDEGVDLTVVDALRVVPSLLIARAGLEPVTLPVPVTGGRAVVLGLPGVADGRFIVADVAVGNATTTFQIMKRNAASDGFDVVENLGSFNGFVTGNSLVASRDRSALAIGMRSDLENEFGNGLGTYMYFKDGAFVCEMLSTIEDEEAIAFTDDDQLIIAGYTVVSCDDERQIDIGRRGDIQVLDGGIVEVSRDLNDVLLIEWLPLQELLALAEPTLLE